MENDNIILFGVHLIQKSEVLNGAGYQQFKDPLIN